MPLKRATGELVVELEGVYFPMLDLTNGRAVRCLCTSEALQDYFGDTQLQPTGRIAVFEASRQEIEKIASDLFDAGNEKPVVSTGSL